MAGSTFVVPVQNVGIDSPVTFQMKCHRRRKVFADGTMEEVEEHVT